MGAHIGSSNGSMTIVVVIAVIVVTLTTYVRTRLGFLSLSLWLGFATSYFEFGRYKYEVWQKKKTLDFDKVNFDCNYCFVESIWSLMKWKVGREGL